MSAPTSAPDGTGTYVLRSEGRHNRVHAVIQAVVLAQPKGRPIGRTSDWRARTVLPQEAGVREVRLHDDRHTAGTLLPGKGAN